MEDGDWVMVRRAAGKDIWEPTCNRPSETAKPLKITFSGPAKFFTDAIPIGNGRLGCMVWGGVSSELLQLNEDTLWTGVPGNYTDPDAPKALSEVRNLVDKGDYVQATSAAVKLLGKPKNAYQPLGDIKFEFGDSHLAYAEEAYYRELDLDTATASVKYSVGDVECTREHFASHPDQVIVTRISASKSGFLSFSVSLDSKLDHHSYVDGENRIVMEGSCPSERIIPPESKDNSEDPKGIQFSAVLHLQISGAMGLIHVLDDKTLKVEGADCAVLLLLGSSSFESPFIKPSDSKKDPTSECLHALKSITKFSYADLHSRHLEDYQDLFHRVSLHLWNGSNKSTGEGPVVTKDLIPSKHNMKIKEGKDYVVSTAERIQSFHSDEDPSLLELLFQFGRYLLISCSRPGTQIANLQGIWNEDLDPKWQCAPHVNINLEMNYWPSLPCNLSECQEPLIDFIRSLSVNGSKTAQTMWGVSRVQVMLKVEQITNKSISLQAVVLTERQVNYEASGWVVHHSSDIWAKSSADTMNPKWALWPMGGAWLCTHLWEHYNFTMDKDFLETTAYPLLEGCTLFLLDWLIEGNGGYLETNPSTSPEHEFIVADGRRACVSYSSTMDMEIIKEVFSAITSASKILGRDGDALIQKVRNALMRLRPIRVADDGSVMEWAEDFKDPEVHHRHLSHLFGIFPGHTITLQETPDLCKAAEITLYRRGEGGPAWSTAWKIALWARLHNSEHAYRMVKHLIELATPSTGVGFEGGLYSNLFTAHPPFQIDGNFGFAAAMTEMLIQSTVKDLYLLPALPWDKWANGCVKGLKARGGVTVSICWRAGDLHEVGLWSTEHNSLRRLHYRGIVVSANISAGRVYTFNKELRCISTRGLS